MRVSQGLDYVLRALTVLAQRPPGTTLVAGDVALELGLPKRFLEQQFTLLAKHGIVECRRGAGGGCALARAAEDITVGEVVRAMQGDVLDVPHVSGSAVSEMWGEAAGALVTALDERDLASLARRQTELDAARGPMYHI